MEEEALMSARPQVIPRSCESCDLPDRPFCGSSASIAEAFRAAGYPAAFPRGAVLFRDGDPPRGIFVVCSGKVKLTATSAGGRSLIARIVTRGGVLGMPAMILDRPYDTTAEVIDAAHVTWLPRDAFMRMIQSPDAAVQVARYLSSTSHAMQHDLQQLLLAPTAADRLARLLLEWCEREGIQGPGGVRIQVTYTHEEIAQFIGTTRETVTRMLSMLKRKGAITTRGATMYVDVAKMRSESGHPA